MRPVPRFLALAAIVLGALVAPAPAALADTPPPLVAHAVASGLADPTAFTVAKDGRIFYAERQTGRIRILVPGVSNTVFFKVPGVVSTDGLVGLALHPRFPTTAYVYAYASRSINGVERDQLLRITASGNKGSNLKVLRSIKAGTSGLVHHGGRILFGPDRKLYLMIGDEGNPANAQDLASTAGKILRLNANGSPATGNPFPNSPVFAYGLRNTIGFDFDPATGTLWETDNGPECNDELNRVVAGGNYGWGPTETCLTPPDAPANTNQDGPSPILPELWYATPTAPTGLAFCAVCGLGAAYDGTLLFSQFLTGNVIDVQLDAAREHPVATSVVYTHPDRLRSMEVGPDGAIYVSDNVGIYRLDLAP